MDIIIILITSAAGATSTYYVSEKLNLGALKASALLSLFVAFPFEFFEFSEDLVQIPTVFFGASFVGMASAKIYSNLNIIIASLIFGGLFYILHPNFKSIGGCLGVTAAISCLTALGLKKLTNLLPKRSQS